MGEYIKKKKDMKFKSQDSLNQVQNVLAEANVALNDNTRTIKTSSIPEALAGALGVGTGGAIGFAALYLGGSVAGLSAAGITSGLAAAGTMGFDIPFKATKVFTVVPYSSAIPLNVFPDCTV